MWKSARHCGAKHVSESKCAKHLNVGALLEVEMFKKCCGGKHISKSKVLQTDCLGPSRTIFGRSDAVSCGKHRRDSAPFVAVATTLAGVRICEDACRVAGAVQATCSSEMLGGQGAGFLRGVAFWSLISSGLLR